MLFAVNLQGKRRLYSLGIAAVLLLALAVMLFLRFHAPPEVARLLPESDALLYLNPHAPHRTSIRSR